MLRIQAKACRIACALLLATLAVAPAARAFEPTSASRPLAAALRDETSQLTETWLFRWTPE